MATDQSTQSSKSPSAARDATLVAAPRQRNAELVEFLGVLLRFQCRLLGADTGAIYMVPGPTRAGGIASAIHHGEHATLDEPVAKRLTAIAERAVNDNGRPIAEPVEITGPGDLYGNEPTHLALAVPLRAEGSVEGAAVVLAPRSTRDPDEALAKLGLTTSRFEAHLWRRSALQEAEQKVVLRETLVLLDRAQQGTDAKSMASLMVDELRRRFACTRVSIGLINADRVRVVAVSGSDDLDKHAPAVEALEAVMEETALQDTEVIYPAPDAIESDPAQRRVIQEHVRLSESFGPSSVVSLPLRIEGDLIGVVVLERDQTDPFPAASLPLVRLIAEFVGPAVYTRRLADRRFPQVLRDDIRDLGGAIVGPRHTAVKLVGLLVIIVLAVAAFVPIPARIAAPMELKATTSRAIVAPFAGYLASSHVRPGDRVETGDLLVEMSTDELELSLAEVQATLDTLRAKRDDALSRGQRSDARTVQAEIDEAEVSAQLVRTSLANSQIRAPIAGLVSIGDLERLEGAPVDATKVLLEIVSDDTLAIIEVAETDAERMEQGQTGWITTRGNAGRRIPVTVNRINPVAQIRDGRSVYLVEASIEAASPELRPGMTGSARLRAGWSTTLWELARPVVDVARLRLWW